MAREDGLDLPLNKLIILQQLQMQKSILHMKETK